MGKTPVSDSQLECMLELSSGISCAARIVNLSMDAALVSSNMLMMPGARVPKAGDTGLMTFSASVGGKRETLKIPCRVAYVNSGQLGVNIMSPMLTNQQQALLTHLVGG
ncbi:MAG: hypothetical protein V2J55_11240 [Candidatus Competibacteraceae bacterium]|jgi:hypothetical protein|nr:hypothetical protein [Candidatus Competibacteraceae bacterium]